jgi:hypothetical protein
MVTTLLIFTQLPNEAFALTRRKIESNKTTRLLSFIGHGQIESALKIAPLFEYPQLGLMALPQ